MLSKGSKGGKPLTGYFGLQTTSNAYYFVAAKLAQILYKITHIYFKNLVNNHGELFTKQGFDESHIKNQAHRRLPTRGGASPKYVGKTNQATKTCKNLNSFEKSREASSRKFRNFRINLVHSGVYPGGFFVEMET